MEKNTVRHLAKVLRVLVLAVLVLNLICLLLVPGIVAYVSDGGPGLLVRAVKEEVEMWLGQGNEAHFSMAVVFLTSWTAVWGEAYTSLLTLFYWLCGICTALILWQAKKVLNTVLAGDPFRMVNAHALKRAAICCWLISGAALVRLILWLWMERNAAPVFTYNTLFVPAFFMAGLLFQVMSALFRQAAELKEDQDLTL